MISKSTSVSMLVRTLRNIKKSQERKAAKIKEAEQKKKDKKKIKEQVHEQLDKVKEKERKRVVKQLEKEKKVAELLVIKERNKTKANQPEIEEKARELMTKYDPLKIEWELLETMNNLYGSDGKLTEKAIELKSQMDNILNNQNGLKLLFCSYCIKNLSPESRPERKHLLRHPGTWIHPECVVKQSHDDNNISHEYREFGWWPSSNTLVEKTDMEHIFY
jgi:hypothetical protein